VLPVIVASAVVAEALKQWQFTVLLVYPRPPHAIWVQQDVVSTTA
jgi:hypothetical protein